MNVFLVTSPFQYICANEARLHYKTKNNTLVIVEQDVERGKKNMEYILDKTVWDEIISIPRSQRTLRIPRVINKIKNKNKKIERLILSEYHGWRSNLFMANFPSAELIYIDDGSATLIEYEELIVTKKPYQRKRLLNDLLIRFQKIKPATYIPFNKNLEIFTIFNLKKNHCKITKNNMEGLRKNLLTENSFNIESPIGFIGEANVDAGKDCIKLSDYLKEINKILDNTTKDIVYFPHRMETKKIRDKIESINRIKYHNSTMPLELEISKSNLSLSKLIGYSSTALYTLSIIYNEIPLEIITSNNLSQFSTPNLTNNHMAKQLK
uniref:Glycosyltransferase 52 family protein n=1 Tax=Aliivibrio wodanis TaxID=80852 RepID=A0A5Q4ZG02_9GAMM|nr:hypothetical protein AW0309160_00155 [Aliivibrio wodanis]